MRLPTRLTDSSAGTASATTVAALADGTTYATDVAAMRSNFATLTANSNSQLDVLEALIKRLEVLEGGN